EAGIRCQRLVQAPPGRRVVLDEQDADRFHGATLHSQASNAIFGACDGNREIRAMSAAGRPNSGCDSASPSGAAAAPGSTPRRAVISTSTSLRRALDCSVPNSFATPGIRDSPGVPLSASRTLMVAPEPSAMARPNGIRAVASAEVF